MTSNITWAVRAIAYHTSAACPEYNDANVNLNNCSVKKLILCYIVKTISLFLLSFANKNITYNATAELFCISEQHSSVFWMNPHFEQIEWINDS